MRTLAHTALRLGPTRMPWHALTWADALAGTAGGLGVLTTHTQAPVVAQTAVIADLLQALQVITEGSVQTRGGQLQEQMQAGTPLEVAVASRRTTPDTRMTC